MKCPICKQHETESLVCLGEMPLSVLGLQSDPDKSIEGKIHEVSMYRCMLCGHVYNDRYDPEFSQVFEGGCTMYNQGGPWFEHMKDVAKRILPGPTAKVVEIGAGNGEFARLVATNRYVAYEPTMDANECSKYVSTVRDYFVPEADLEFQRPDVLLMRHVLEHFTDPIAFMRRLSIESKRCEVYPLLTIEVPNVQNALQDTRIEDWVYEHPHHFTPNSLIEAARLSGWCCSDMYITYNGEVIVGTFEVFNPCRMRSYEKFQALKSNFTLMRDELVEMNQRRPGSVVLWGGAGKGATLINLLNLSIPVVDSDSRKWDRYVPGTAYPIKDPAILYELKPDLVVATTSWRVGDIAEEIIREGYPVGRVANFSDGRLITYQG